MPRSAVDSFLVEYYRRSGLGAIADQIAEDSDPAAQSLKSAGKLWQAMVRQGDASLEVIDTMGKAAEALVAEDIPERKASVAVDVKRATDAVASEVNRVYGLFAQGREAFYAAMKEWNLSTRRSAKTKAKTPAKVDGLATDKLEGQISQATKNLLTGAQSMLEMGASTARAFLSAAKGEVPDEQRKTLLEQGLDFRDVISEVYFARVNGIMRRVSELLTQAWAAREESAEKTWKAPWASDPEIGDKELL